MSVLKPTLVAGKFHLALLSPPNQIMRIHHIDVATQNLDGSGWSLGSIAYVCKLGVTCPICDRTMYGGMDLHMSTEYFDGALALDLNDGMRPVIINGERIPNVESLVGNVIYVTEDFVSIESEGSMGFRVDDWTCTELPIISTWEEVEDILDYSLQSLIKSKLCKYTL